jgi:hypothetical protein
MTRVLQLEQQIAELSPEELAIFRKWFAEFDAEMWDRQIEADAGAGKLDALAQKALRDHAAGNRPGFEPPRHSRLLGLLPSSPGRGPSAGG